MVSLDLSKAFDMIPKWALQASLEYAQVDAAVIKAVLAVHEQCAYNIMRSTFADSIRMLRGVRKGCSSELVRHFLGMAL